MIISGIPTEVVFFCNVVHGVREVLDHLYFTSCFEELVNCYLCENGHTYYLVDLYDTKVLNKYSQ
jgi:hypothetical protein